MRLYCSLNLLNNYWTFFVLFIIVFPPKRESSIAKERQRKRQRERERERVIKRGADKAGATTTANKYNANYQWTA